MTTLREAHESIKALVTLLTDFGVDPVTQVQLFRAEVLDHQLALCGGNQCELADRLGIHRNTVARQMKNCGVPKPAHRQVR